MNAISAFVFLMACTLLTTVVTMAPAAYAGGGDYIDRDAAGLAQFEQQVEECATAFVEGVLAGEDVTEETARLIECVERIGPIPDG